MFNSDWEFTSNNNITSQEIFNAIFQERIEEGFVFINTFNR
jgi:hypothetical protein